MADVSQSAIWNGSEFVPCSGIPVSDRGFRYGMSLFESLAVRGGKAEFLAAHIARLEAACRRCGWTVDRDAFAASGAWLEAIPGPMFARIYVTAGDGGPAAPVLAPRILLFAERRGAAGATDSLRLRIHPEPFLPLLDGLKTANYWANAEALRMSRAAGCDEALLLNPRGVLISACMANVFVELDGAWVTPPVSSGARAGVVREWVMRRREVRERELSAPDLEKSTACFLTSCWSGVTPVAALEGRELDTRFAEELRAEFFNRE
jgi:branched-subunit amino acid aminotransferase/4-amino-4-deoxychorismate lyase